MLRFSHTICIYLVSPLYGDQTCVCDVCENGMRVGRKRRVKWRREGEIERKGQIKGAKEREISCIQTQSSVCDLFPTDECSDLDSSSFPCDLRNLPPLCVSGAEERGIG